MVEFGEQLKRAREAKGMTQQTLAEQLFVTRQAVSRWECGDRFPDLITTKEISRILDISLDDLLSDNDMEKAVERNPVIEKSLINNIMIVLYSCVVFSYIIMIVDILMRFPLGSKYIDYSDIQLIIIQITGLVVQIVAFTYALAEALKGMLSPKRIGIVNIIFFASVIFTNSYNIFIGANIGNSMWNIRIFILIIFRIVPGIAGAAASYMFFVKRNAYKKWRYLIIISSCFCILRIIISYTSLAINSRQHLTMNHALNLLLNICIYLLIIYQTFVLNKKMEEIKSKKSI